MRIVLKSIGNILTKIIDLLADTPTPFSGVYWPIEHEPYDCYNNRKRDNLEKQYKNKL